MTRLDSCCKMGEKRKESKGDQHKYHAYYSVREKRGDPFHPFEEAEKEEEKTSNDHPPFNGLKTKGSESHEAQEKCCGRSFWNGILMADKSLQEGCQARDQQEPLKKIDLAQFIQPDGFRSNGGVDDDDGDEDDRPLNPINQIFEKRRLIIELVD